MTTGSCVPLGKASDFWTIRTSFEFPSNTIEAIEVGDQLPRLVDLSGEGAGTVGLHSPVALQRLVSVVACKTACFRAGKVAFRVENRFAAAGSESRGSYREYVGRFVGDVGKLSSEHLSPLRFP